MSNIISRGLGKIQSLVTKGFGGLSVVVDKAGGSITKLFLRDKKYVNKIVKIDVNGKVLFHQVKKIFLKYSVTKAISLLYNVIGRKKKSSQYSISYTSRIKRELFNSIDVLGLKYFKKSSNYLINSKIKFPSKLDCLIFCKKYFDKSSKYLINSKISRLNSFKVGIKTPFRNAKELLISSGLLVENKKCNSRLKMFAVGLFNQKEE